MCYESFECADGQFCQKLDGEFQGVCIVADIEDNNISTGMVHSKTSYIAKMYQNIRISFLSSHLQIQFHLIMAFQRYVIMTKINVKMVTTVTFQRVKPRAFA